jgi:hypothetical protein
MRASISRVHTWNILADNCTNGRPGGSGFVSRAQFVGAEYAKGLRGIGRQALLHGLLAQGQFRPLA